MEPAFIELERIKELAAQKVERDTTPIELARALKAIKDHRWYYSYRCRSFREFVKRELPICRATAKALIRIVETFERLGYTERQISELRAVSWAKLLETLPLLTRDNADYWINRAQDTRLPRLRELIRQTQFGMGARKVA